LNQPEISSAGRNPGYPKRSVHLELLTLYAQGGRAHPRKIGRPQKRESHDWQGLLTVVVQRLTYTKASKHSKSVLEKK